MDPVYVYRNLKHGRAAPPLYSIMQGGKVIGRAARVLLCDVTFVVREAGRQRVLREGRKCVHAFAKGSLVDSRGAFGIDENDKRGLPVRVSYDPHQGPHFMDSHGPVKGARVVLLNEHGMSAAYLER